MTIRIVGTRLESPIKPRHICLAKSGPAMLGTLGSYESEQVVTDFVRQSQDVGFWVGFVFLEEDDSYAQMVEKGYLSATKTSEGWLYQLTPRTIGQIYFVQSEATIASLQAQLRRAQEGSLFGRIKRRLREMFASVQGA